MIKGEDIWILDLSIRNFSKQVLRLYAYDSKEGKVNHLRNRWLSLDFFSENGLTHIQIQNREGSANLTNFLRFIKKNFGDILEKIKEEEFD